MFGPEFQVVIVHCGADASGKIGSCCEQQSLMISSNGVDSNRRVRIPKFEFTQIQKNIETTLQQEYPVLSEKTIYNKPWEKNKKESHKELLNLLSVGHMSVFKIKPSFLQMTEKKFNAPP